ncbi:MAG: leucine-rich repeat domain-containing protein [Oscillospiraceae bacterium]|nr:leucine-rich repeat domain-containing protein [Oscillospiraceae bacterium]
MRRLTIILVLSLLLSINIFSAETRGNFTCEFDNLNGVIITGCSIDDIRIEIPEKIGVRYVRGISETAFENCTNVQYIFIPAFVNHIDETTFNNLHKLKAVFVEKTNKWYANDAYGALYNKRMTTLIQYPAANDSKIFLLPDTVHTILSHALDYTPSLSVFRVAKSSKFFSVDENNVLFNKDKTKLIRVPMGKTEYTIPSGVVEIGISAFANCDNLEQIKTDSDAFVSVKGVLYNADMTTLGKYPAAMKGDTFVVPDGVILIAERAFENNKYLTKVTMPESLKTVGRYAFKNCTKLKQIAFLGEVIDQPDSSVFESDVTFYYRKDLTSWETADWTKDYKFIGRKNP